MPRKFAQNLTNEEIERRRAREDFSRWYQEHCDTLYWTNGKCCAGCDYWDSDRAGIGACHYAGIIDGDQVLASMGITWHTLHNPKPGYPFTLAEHVCANFRDEFDWSTLPDDYLEKIGAKGANNA